jgi:hypothetical protein
VLKRVLGLPAATFIASGVTIGGKPGGATVARQLAKYLLT